MPGGNIVRRSITSTLAATGVGLLSLLAVPAVASAADTPGYTSPPVISSGSGGGLPTSSPASGSTASAPAAGTASSVSAPASGLAFTGANVAETAAGGVMAIALGAGLVRASRRRHASPAA